MPGLSGYAQSWRDFAVSRSFGTRQHDACTQRQRLRRLATTRPLHKSIGLFARQAQWAGRFELPECVDRAFAVGQAREMLVVIPDAHTLQMGSFYSTSVTTGDWERYIARDLVAYIDSHYRTIAARDARGLAGHSMGGYGRGPQKTVHG
jgi:hypothetical protein